MSLPTTPPPPISIFKAKFSKCHNVVLFWPPIFEIEKKHLRLKYLILPSTIKHGREIDKARK